MDDKDQDKKPESTPITLVRVLEILDKGTIKEEIGRLRWSSNYTFLLSIDYENTSLTGVYKPRRGERPLWDFPDGTLCQREVATFLTSQELGWEVVPPTVLRDGPHGLGSVQFFIDHDPEYNYFSFDERMAPQLMRLSLFDCVVNNADRKGGHCLVDNQGHLWGIDHGLTFHPAHKLRTVVWDFAGQAIPDDYMRDMEQLCEKTSDSRSGYYKTLCKLLTEEEIKGLQRRVKRLLKSGCYPHPGPGPNYPWPPV